MKTKCPHCHTAVNTPAGRVECPRCGRKFETNPELPEPSAFALDEAASNPPTLQPQDDPPEQTRPARRRTRQADEAAEEHQSARQPYPAEWMVCLALVGTIAVFHASMFNSALSAIQEAATAASAAAWTMTVYVITCCVEKLRRPRQ